MPSGHYADMIETPEAGRRRSRARSYDIDGHVLGTPCTASFISPSASGAASASRPARRFMWCGSMP